MKKISVIGRGSVGAIAVAEFLNNTDWFVEWIFDTDIPISSVGEASNLHLSFSLNKLGWRHSDITQKLKGTAKQGIHKKNWSSNDFIHDFTAQYTAIHFSSQNLYKVIFEKIKNNKRLSIKNEHVSDPYGLDSDYVLVCTGTPNELSSKEYSKIKSIPVNSAFIVQCDWDYPRFSYSLTHAMKHGWVFGIPLQDRISIGYLYNEQFNNVEEIQKDIKSVLKDYDLKENGKTNHINFNSYYRTNNFSNKVIYNGNASFFIEPLEAASIGIGIKINEWAYQVWTGQKSILEAQSIYEKNIKDTQSMIILHYLSGSVFQSDFWKFAEQQAYNHLSKEFEDHSDFSQMLEEVLFADEYGFRDVGNWSQMNYKINIEGLGIKEKLLKIRNSTKSIKNN